jgi:hypothetical protein
VLNTYIRRDVAAHILHNTLFATLVQYNQQFIPMRAEKVPVGSGSVTTLAQQYYNLSVLTGEAVANTWANLSGVSIASDMKSAFIIRTVDGNSISARGLQFSQDIPLELLGHEVQIYAHTKVYPTTGVDGQWDRIYGTPKKTARSAEDIEWSNDDRNGGAGETADTVAEVLSYITHGDELNKPNGAANFGTSGAGRIFVDYKAFGSGSEVTVGSPIAFIDNNADGQYDWALARNLLYSKVTAVGTDADEKITATRGSIDNGGFENGRSLNAVKRAEIYGGEELKVDDRALVYGVDGKFGVEIVAPSKGTLTQARDGGNIAVISGTEYRQSALLSRVSNIEGVLDGRNFNVERDFYFHAARSQILEGPGGAPDTSKWALVLDSYWTGGILTGAADARVRLLFDDNQKGNYNVSAIKDATGKAYSLSQSTSTYASKIKLVDDGHTGANAVAAAFPRGTGDSAQVLAGEFAYIFKATVSEDGASVELQNPGVEYATNPSGSAAQQAGEESADGLTYTKGNSYFGSATAPLTAASRLMDGSVVFGVDLDTVTSGGVAEDAAAFKGRSIDSFGGLTSAGGRISYVSVMHDGKFDDDPLIGQKPITAMAIIADNVPSKAKVAGNFAYVMNIDVVTVNDAGKFYSELTLFDGTEVKQYTTADGIRSQYDWTNEKINDPQTGLTGYQTLRVSNEDGIQYALNADGKISSLVTYTKLDGSAGKSFGTAAADGNRVTNNGAGNGYLGYFSYDDTNSTFVYPASDVKLAPKEIFLNNDTNVYLIKSATEVTKLTSIAQSGSTWRNAYKALFLTENSGSSAYPNFANEVAHTVYILQSDYKDLGAEREEVEEVVDFEFFAYDSTHIGITAQPDKALTILGYSTDFWSTEEEVAAAGTSGAGYTAVTPVVFNTADPAGTMKDVSGTWAVDGSFWLHYTEGAGTGSKWVLVEDITTELTTALVTDLAAAVPAGLSTTTGTYTAADGWKASSAALDNTSATLTMANFDTLFTEATTLGLPAALTVTESTDSDDLVETFTVTYGSPALTIESSNFNDMDSLDGEVYIVTVSITPTTYNTAISKTFTIVVDTLAEDTALVYAAATTKPALGGTGDTLAADESIEFTATTAGAITGAMTLIVDGDRTLTFGDADGESPALTLNGGALAGFTVSGAVATQSDSSGATGTRTVTVEYELYGATETVTWTVNVITAP